MCTRFTTPVLDAIREQQRAKSDTGDPAVSKFGGDFHLSNSDSAVGTLTVNPVVFNGGVSVAANTAFDPVAAGATTIALVQPTGFEVPSNVPSSIVATVTGP